MLPDTDTPAAVDSAVDAELLLAVSSVLSQLARHPGDPKQARRYLAELQALHPEHRLHLIPDEEAYDGPCTTSSSSARRTR